MTSLKDDPRAIELGKCVMFALQNFRNSAMMHRETGKVEAWHAWFLRAMIGAGFIEKKKKAGGKSTAGVRAKKRVADTSR